MRTGDLRDRITQAEPTSRVSAAWRTLRQTSAVLPSERPHRRFGITATITTITDGWSSTRQIPYFEVNGTVHGCLTTESARNVALAILADTLDVSRTQLTDPGSPTYASVHAEEVTP